MAEGSKTTEEIIIELKTNFERVLKADLTQYSRFVKSTNQISRSLEKSVSDMSKSVSESVKNMMGNAAKSVQTMMGHSKGLYRQIASQGVKVNELYEKRIQDLKKLQDDFLNSVKKTQKAISALKTAERRAPSEKKRNLIQKRIGELEAKEKELSGKILKDAEKINDDFVKRLSSMASRASGNYAKIAETNLERVRRSVKSINNELSNVKQTSGMQDDVSKIYRYQNAYRKMEKEHANLQKALRSQSKQTVEAQERMETAKTALLSAQNEKVKQFAFESFAKTVGNQKEIMDNYRKMEKEVDDYGSSVNKAEQELKEMANTLRKSISKDINVSNVNRKMEQSMDLLVEYARMTGKNMGDALSKNMTKGRRIEQSLDQDIQKLKQMREQAVQLQKTGIIDARSEINRIDKVLASYQNFWSKFKKEQSKIQNILGQRKGMKMDFGTSEFNKIRKTYNDLSKEVQRFGNIQSDNVSDAHEKIKKLQSYWDQYLTKRRSVTQKIKSLQSEMHKVEVAMSQTTNDKLLAELDSYRKKLESKLNGVRQTLKQSFEPPDAIRDTYRKIEDYIRDTQKNIENQWIRNRSSIEDNFNQINGKFEELSKQTDKLYKKRFISKQAISQLKESFDAATKEADEYEKQINEVRKAIKELAEIQRTGLGGSEVRKQADAMRDNLKEMEDYHRKLREQARKTERDLERLHKRSLKRIVRSGWEMIRNFRWQVAAVIYLITQSIQGVQRFFTDIMNEIAQYRREAMTLAAQFSYSLLGDMRKNFNDVYQYSRKLLERMEQVAAKTILTMEDMTMLVRTFAQAGLIPDPDKDVEKIATIGTAIKTLTEGMANAGTQMRQELYAIIQGRQRVTDQLAMMFRLQFVDIQKVIDDARAKGINMIDALSDALKPFNMLSDRLATEWEAVVNNMKLAWKVIKRVGLEDFLVSKTEKLNEFVKQFYNDVEGLTKKGRETALALRGIFEVFDRFWKLTLDSIKHALIHAGNLGTIIGGIGSKYGNITSKAEGLSKEMKGFLTLLEASAKVLMVMNQLVTGMAININAWAKSVAAGLEFADNKLGKIITKGLFGKKGEAKKEIQDQVDAIKEMLNAWKAVGDYRDDLVKQNENFEKQWKEMIDRIINPEKSKDVELGVVLKLKYRPEMVQDAVAGLQNEMKRAELTSLSGADRIQKEYEQALEAIYGNMESGAVGLKEQIHSNIDAINTFVREAKNANLQFTDEQIKKYMDAQKEYYTMLRNLEQYEEHILKTRNRKLEEYYQKIAEKNAEMKKQRESLLITLRDRPETRLEKIDTWASLMIERIEEIKVKHKLTTDEIDKFWEALSEGIVRRQEQAVQETKQEYDSFIEGLTGHRELNAFEEINNELDKIGLAITRNKNFTDEQVKSLRDLLEITRKERIEAEETNQKYMVLSSQLDTLTTKAGNLANSFRPADNLESEIIQIYTSWSSANMKIIEKLDEINRKYKDEKDIWKKNSEHFQAYAKELVKQYKYIQEGFERELWRKQHPLWNDMIDASQSWADGLSDTLSDLILDFENFGESLKSLQQSILGDVVKTTIKRKLVEPMMNILGSGEPEFKGDGSSLDGDAKSWFEKIFGVGKDIVGMAEGGKPEEAKTNTIQSPQLDTTNSTLSDIRTVINSGFAENKNIFSVETSKTINALNTGLSNNTTTLSSGLSNISTLLSQVIASINSLGTNFTEKFNFTPDKNAMPYMDSIKSAEEKYGIPENLFARLIKQESNFNPNAKSKAGAEGIAQIVPKWHPEAKTDDPYQSIDYGAKYLSQMHDRYGDWRTAVAGYNAGPGNIDKYGGVPPFKETQDYVKKIYDEGIVNKNKKTAEENKEVIEWLVNGKPVPVDIIKAPEISDTFKEEIIKNKEEVSRSSEKVVDKINAGFNKSTSILSQMLSALGMSKAANVANMAGQANGLFDIIGKIGSFFAGGSGGGAGPTHMGSGGTTAFGMAEGGIINEHIVGTGLRSGKTYEFGENAKYGDFEAVVPKHKMKSKDKGMGNFTVHMPINISAIDSRSGVEFLMQNGDVIQAQLVKAIQNNRGIRKALRSY